MSMINPPLAIPTINEIRAKLCVAAFGSPLISKFIAGWWLRSSLARHSAANGNCAPATGAVGISNTPPGCAWK